MLIGILAIQGDFSEHKKMLDQLKISSLLVRNKNDLQEKIDGLILPGGESTAMLKILHDNNMFDELKYLIKNKNIPVLGTCAGLILLAQKINNDNMKCLQILPVDVKRNAFGRQINSFSTDEIFDNLGVIPMVFIRAPYIQKINAKDVKILAKVKDKIVAVRYKNVIGLAFHPELTLNHSIHKYFIEIVKQNTDK